jgi:hypothetical protein
MRNVDNRVPTRRAPRSWAPRSKKRRRVIWTATAAVVVIVGAFAVRLVLLHPVFSGNPPRVRVTVSGGCPHSLGDAHDVSNPGPGFWSEFWHYSELARSGATNGLVCEYVVTQVVAAPQPGPPTESPGPLDGPDVSQVVPLPVLSLQTQLSMTAAEASTLSLAAATQSRWHPGVGDHFNCPPESGGVTIVAFAYPNGPDADIWWNNSGCQNADNGHVEVYFYGAGVDTGGDFPDAVDNVLPAQ